jgi:uncharacterized protein YbjT (DUF2867 family)
MRTELKIAVTGGTGFVGSHVADRLLEKRYNVRIISRRASPDCRDYEAVEADITTGKGLTDAFQGIDCLINTVGIIREAGRNSFEAVHHRGVLNIINACRLAGIKRLLQVSALGVGEGKTNKYFATKYKAERAVIDSGLEYVIFRPSIIFGPGDGFVNLLAGVIRKTPAFPIFGDGGYEMQPVSIHDLARAVVKAVEPGAWDNKIYSIGGPDVYSYKEIVRIIMKVLNKKALLFHIPMWIIKPAVKTAGIIKLPVPMTSEQLSMLTEGGICDNTSFRNDFGSDLTGFERGITEYLTPSK